MFLSFRTLPVIYLAPVCVIVFPLGCAVRSRAVSVSACHRVLRDRPRVGHDAWCAGVVKLTCEKQPALACEKMLYVW